VTYRLFQKIARQMGFGAFADRAFERHDGHAFDLCHLLRVEILTVKHVRGGHIALRAVRLRNRDVDLRRVDVTDFPEIERRR